MMSDYMTDFMDAKYHFSVAKRMMEMYEQYSEKRVLIGVISEAAKSASKLARSYLAYDNKHGNIRTFVLKVGPKYLESDQINAIFSILEIEMAHGESPVDFNKDGKIILLVNGRYKVLTAERLKEFIDLLEISVNKLENIRRQV